jgi:hypothetical protein
MLYTERKMPRRASCASRSAACGERLLPGEIGGFFFMSIVRIGLAETKKFAEGYEAIFGKKNTAKESAQEPSAKRKTSAKKKSKKGKKK